MKKRPRTHARSLPIEKVVFFVSLAFIVSCVIVAVKRHQLSSEREAAAQAATHATTDRSSGAGAAPGADGIANEIEEKSSAARRADWPAVDRGRLRSGVVQDVADAFALGKYSGRVSLSTESEQLVFDYWCARAAAWPDSWNKDPILYADGQDRGGTRVYRVELHGEELGRIHTTRYANGWNIVGIERKITKDDLLAEERILREAAARAGVVRKVTGFKASTSLEASNEEREQREK